TWGRPYSRGIRAKEPMPSGDADSEEGAHAAEVGAAFGRQRAGGGRIEAVLQARAGAAGATLGGAGPRGQAARQAAAAVAHGRLAAAATGAGVGAAAGRGQEIAGPGAIAEAAGPVGRQAGDRG